MGNPGVGGFCELHGPFDPPHASCPYCAMGNNNPSPYYDDDEMPTNIGGEYRAPQAPPLAPAQPPSGFSRYDDEAPTEYNPGGHRGSSGSGQPVLDEPTRMPQRMGGDIFDDDRTVLQVTPTGPLGFLVIKEPQSRRGTVHRISDNDTLGRRNTSVILDDKKVSKQHARFRLEEDEETGEPIFYVYEFGSENGTFLNGKRIRGAEQITENDVLQVGDTVMVFKTLF